VAVDERFAAYRQSGDRTLRNQMIEEHRGLAVHCARRFQHRGEPLEDLVQVAQLGVLKAIERFDPGVGVVFTTFAVPTIMGELRRHFRDKTWMVHVPRREKDRYQAVSHIPDQLSQELGRSPTVPEIAERAGLDVEETLAALEVGGCYHGAPLGPLDGDTPDTPTLGIEDAGIVAAEARFTVGALLDVLPSDRDRKIIKLRFIEGMTQSQIADRVGISQVQVSRLIRDSLARMRIQLLSEDQRAEDQRPQDQRPQDERAEDHRAEDHRAEDQRPQDRLAGERPVPA
jgi:RNA polymerase sigma-B factor